MTDKPKTLSLNTRQWRVLLHDNLDVLKAAVQSTETIDETGLKQIHAQLDDMKMLAAAWFQVGIPPGEPVDAKGDALRQALLNSAGMPEKKRRGRRTNAEKAAMAQQAVQ